MKTDTPPSIDCVGCGREGHLWESDGVPWFWCLNSDCRYWIGPHWEGSQRGWYAHINALVNCVECGQEYHPDDKRDYLTPERHRCAECRLGNPPGSMGELWTDYIKCGSSKTVDQHPCWAELLAIYGTDGETDPEKIYDRFKENIYKLPLVNRLDKEELETTKVGEILDLNVREYWLPLVKRYQSRWSEQDVESVAKAVKRSGVLRTQHFRWFTSSYYNEATSDDPRPDADLLPKQEGFRWLLPDLFNVDTVKHKATVLAATYVYYTDTHYPGSSIEQSFKDDMLMIWWHLWSSDVQHVPLIDKREYQTILGWVDEVKTVCEEAEAAWREEEANWTPKKMPRLADDDNSIPPELNDKHLSWGDYECDLTPNQTLVAEWFIDAYTHDPMKVLKGTLVCKECDLDTTNLKHVFNKGKSKAWELFRQVTQGQYRLEYPNPSEDKNPKTKIKTPRKKQKPQVKPQGL